MKIHTSLSHLWTEAPDKVWINTWARSVEFDGPRKGLLWKAPVADLPLNPKIGPLRKAHSYYDAPPAGLVDSSPAAAPSGVSDCQWDGSKHARTSKMKLSLKRGAYFA